jgi:hypothetical protein
MEQLLSRPYVATALACESAGLADYGRVLQYALACFHLCLLLGKEPTVAELRQNCVWYIKNELG